MLSAKSKYAIISIVDIAVNQGESGYINVACIAKRHSISEKLLEAILPILKKQGLLISSLGPGGGYRLKKNPADIFLIQITDAVNQSFKVTRCDGYGYGGCVKQNERCVTHDLWYLLEKRVKNFLDEVTVEDVILGKMNKKHSSQENLQNFIYMDNNATTAPLAYVKEKILFSMENAYNPSSIHRQGQIARKIVEEARQNIKTQLCATDEYDLVFTSCGTEANNMVFHSFANYHHIISAIEHSSVIKPAKYPIFIPVRPDGVVDIEKFQEILEKVSGKKLVSVIYANNETGVIQPLKQIIQIAKKHDAIVHTDAVQTLGKVEFSIADLNADLITISSHKIGGGFGSGGLIYKKELKIKPMILGGQQEKGLRAGTENVSAIYGFSAAANFLKDSVFSMNFVEELRNYMESEIQKKIPTCIIAGQNVQRLPNTSCVLVPQIENMTQLMHFDLHKICLSIGSACSSGQVAPSSVLLAMGFSPQDAKSSIRISLSIQNTKKEVDNLVQAWEMLYNGCARGG